MLKYIVLVFMFILITFINSYAACYDKFKLCEKECEDSRDDLKIYQCKSICTNTLIWCSKLMHKSTRRTESYNRAKEDNYDTISELENNNSSKNKNVKKVSSYELMLNNGRYTTCTKIYINDSTVSCIGDIEITYQIDFIKQVGFSYNGIHYNIMNKSDNLIKFALDNYSVNPTTNFKK